MPEINFNNPLIILIVLWGIIFGIMHLIDTIREKKGKKKVNWAHLHEKGDLGTSDLIKAYGTMGQMDYDDEYFHNMAYPYRMMNEKNPNDFNDIVNLNSILNNSKLNNSK